MSRRVFLIILSILIILLTASIFILFPLQPTALAIEKEPCPYECCVNDNYLKKGCEKGYDCVDFQCVLKDSDGDRLTDEEEIDLGTDPKLYDSDGDTLSDYDEVEILKTNPLNSNTDGDRYRDNEDTNPNTINTAKIDIQLIDKDWNWNYDNLIILTGTLEVGGSLNPNMAIADPSITIIASNSGDDYTSFVNFDLVFEISDKEIYREYLSLGKFERGEEKTKEVNRELQVKDIPQTLLDTLYNETANWDIKIENLEYEKWV